MSGFDPARLERIQAHFDRYVEDGRLPGWLVVIARDGEVVHRALSGRRDVEADAPVEPDTLWRIYSMTKPITSVAAMMLWEEGHFELKDPIARFLPEFAEPRVFDGGAMAKVATVPATEPIRMWHLLTHTSGLTYGFHHHGAVDEIYRAEGFEWGTPPGMDLAACCEAWAGLPLLFQPGSEWNYGVSTDVLGRVIEVISGQPLDEFLAARVLGPLGMVETGFFAAEPDHGRLAALYTPDPETGRATRSPMSVAATRRPDCLSGGGGLVSSADDYARFTRMLLGRGEVDGVRLLGPRTLRLMASNQLPGHADLEAYGRPLFAETTFDGVGFGLGFSVVEDPIARSLPHLTRRVRLGRRGQHGVLGRSRRAARGAVLHPAAAVEHAPDPLAAAPAGPPGAGGLGGRDELGADPLEPRRGRAEAGDPLELLDEALRAPVDGEHVQRGGEHQRVVVEHRPEHVGDPAQLGIVRRRQPRAQTAEAADQRPAPRRELGQRLAAADGGEQLLRLVLPDHRLGDDRAQLAPRLLGARRVRLVVADDRHDAGPEVRGRSGIGVGAPTPEHQRRFYPCPIAAHGSPSRSSRAGIVASVKRPRAGAGPRAPPSAAAWRPARPGRRAPRTARPSSARRCCARCR